MVYTQQRVCQNSMVKRCNWWLGQRVISSKLKHVQTCIFGVVTRQPDVSHRLFTIG
eukprot:m.10468 g.10468  ORF g.10468 m.10468 type:complete len:56 (+) comp5570_c0_seq1:98-265(+)